MLNENSTFDATKSHLGNVNSPNPDRVSQVKELPKHLTAFIPSNLNLDELLLNNAPNFKYDKDNFIYLMDLIYKMSGKQKKDDYSFYSTPYSRLMQNRVRLYDKHLAYLVNHGILDTDSQYIVGKKSIGFAFSVNYSTELKETRITNPKLIKKILKFYKSDTKEKPILDNEDIELNYLYKWLENGKLRIDYKLAKQYLKDLFLIERNTFTETKEYKKLSKSKDFNFQQYKRMVAYQKYNSRLRVLKLFHKGTFNARLDKTAGRLHSTLTQLKSDLRQFITYDGLSLVATDITNSQPYLLSTIISSKNLEKNNIVNIIKLYNPKFNNQASFPIMLAKMVKQIEDKEDVAKYLNTISNGNFYEEFGKLIDIENRKVVKNCLFSSIFSPNQLNSHIEGIQHFKKEFPNVFKVITKIKHGKGYHRALACTLQHFEANLILHKACKKIYDINPEIPMFTLHDSIITTSQYQSIVNCIMSEVLTEAIGFPPKFKIEKWERVA